MIRSGVLFLLIGGLFFLVGCRAAEPTPIPTQPPTLTAQPGFTPTPSPQPASPLPTVVQNEASATTTATTPAQPAVETQTAVETLPPAETQLPAATQTAEASPSPEPTTEAAPTASPAPESPTAAAQVCLDVGAFYGDLSIPDDTFFYQGESFTKSWQLKNEGTCTWDAGYTVVYNSGDPLGAPLTNPLPQVVAPGQTVDIHLDMFAPAAGGTYWSNWELQNAQGNRFGLGKTGKDLFWARIQVSWLAPGESAPPGDSAPIGGGGETSAPVSGSCAAQINPAFVSEVIRLINAARAANGLPALLSNAQLAAAAQVHSLDMACNNFISHTGSDGSSWGTRIAAQGYAASLALENIYSGDPTFGGDAQGAVNWWLNSAVHYANIMNPKVTEIGVGYASSASALYVGRLTAVFAAP